MATRTVTLVSCDRCKAKDITSHVHVSPAVGWITCAAGGPGDDDRDDLDLCCKCASLLMGRMLKPLAYDEARAWAAGVRAGK